MEATTLTQASNSVLPLQIEEMISKMIAPINNPIKAPIVKKKNALTPPSPAKRPPPNTKCSRPHKKEIS